MLTLPPYYILQDLQRSKSKEIEVFRTVKMKEKKKVRITNSISRKKVTNMLKKTQVSSLADEDTCDGC
jgi:ABC-type Mn2+/Zn2+ transport system ATPase subunit